MKCSECSEFGDPDRSSHWEPIGSGRAIHRRYECGECGNRQWER